MFLTSIFNVHGQKRPARRQITFERLEDRRFCTGAAGLALTNPMAAMAGAVPSPAAAVATARQLVELNPQPEPPLGIVLKL
jgi:hypothetical protein